MRNDGSSSEDEFVKRWQDAFGKEVFVKKLTDTKSIRKVSNGPFNQQAPATPADFIVTVKGRMFYAEVKSCSNKTSFPFSQFTKSQRAAMLQQAAAGGMYMVYIHNMNTNDWFEVSGPKLLELEKFQKSIKWSELAGTRWLIT